MCWLANFRTYIQGSFSAWSETAPSWQGKVIGLGTRWMATASASWFFFFFFRRIHQAADLLRRAVHMECNVGGWINAMHTSPNSANLLDSYSLRAASWWMIQGAYVWQILETETWKQTWQKHHKPHIRPLKTIIVSYIFQPCLFHSLGLQLREFALQLVC